MTIKEEILIRKVAETLANNIKLPELDVDSIVNSAALQMLEEIQAVLAKDKELEDFEIVEEIVEIFIRYGVDFKGCHDYY